MARTLKDLTVALTVMSSVGYDPADNETAAIPPSSRDRDYSADLYPPRAPSAASASASSTASGTTPPPPRRPPSTTSCAPC